MKLFAMSLFFFGTLGAFKSDDVPQLLDQYIKWTQTGEPDLSKTIFEAEVGLTYQAGKGESTSTPFYEYLIKVEKAATSVPRSMAVTDVNLFENKARAYLTDHSADGDFALVHILNVRKRENKWRIHAIKILDGPDQFLAGSDESPVKN